VSPENHNTAGQNVEVDYGFQRKLQDLHIPLDLLYFKNSLGVGLMFQAFLYLSIDLKEPKVPEYFENAIDHGAPIIQVVKYCVGTSNVYDLQKELRAHILQDHTK
jgi:hypothetical protein|tara:strand:+ start:148 stop:462 length:315 start_codon:yes stop_codon:yes gene_type:complete